MKNKKIIIAGGTGFIGQALAARWGKDNRVVILSRRGAVSQSAVSQTAGEWSIGGQSVGARSAGAQNNSYSTRLLSAEDGYNITYWRWDGRSVEKHWSDEIDGA